MRRNFSFRRGEKSLINRIYRRLVDHRLSRRHLLTHLFYSLPPLDPRRLHRIFSAAREFSVELETHPINPQEYQFLIEGEIFRVAGDLRVERGFSGPLRERLAIRKS